MSEKSKSDTRPNSGRASITNTLGTLVVAGAVALVGEQGISHLLRSHDKTVNVPEVIHQHDTLWSAVERADKRMHVSADPREEVYRISSELGTSVVAPGEHITVHVKK